MAAELKSIAYDELFTSRNDECFLGEGSFSQVYRCHHRTYGDVAVKILNACSRNPIRSFNREGLMHLKANTCQNILTLFGIAQRESFVGLVLEYMPYGSLATALFDNAIQIPWTFRLRALGEVASAIYYLHHLSLERRLVHCDLKVENILLNADLRAKIGDFGGADFSTFTGLSVSSTSRGRPTVDQDHLQYTLSYAAPELITNIDARRTTYMDVYSFAIILYVVTTRSVPFSGKSADIIIHAVTNRQRPQQFIEDVEDDLREFNDDIGMQVYRLFTHLMPQCWHHEPARRMKIANVRDSLVNKFQGFQPRIVEEEISSLKRDMTLSPSGRPTNSVPIVEKYEELVRKGVLKPAQYGQGRMPSSSAQSHQSTSRPRPPSQSRRVHSTSDSHPHVARPLPAARSTSSPETTFERPSHHAPSQSSVTLVKQVSGMSIEEPRSTEARPARLLPQPHTPSLHELEMSFRDPYLRQGSEVTMIADIAAVKNAQVGHGGWLDKLSDFRGVQGIVRSVETNGDVTVNFSGVASHRFNPNALTKLPSDNDLSVGDFVIITLEKDVVKMMQEGHGGWVDDMHRFFNQRGLVFRFLPDRDVLVVYKNGMYFRFNPEVLKKDGGAEEVTLQDNPDIKIGDYVFYDFDDEFMKEFQERSGGWNNTMSDLRGKVGKFVYADYHGRAFIAFSSKLCFVFNPVVLSKLSNEEALRRFKASKDEVRRLAQAKTEDQMSLHRFAVDDRVRVRLPLDIVVELQRGHGGWCYQMLEVYGVSGIVKDFDDGNNAQVLFDTGNKWTFNPAALEKVTGHGQNVPDAYVPPFKIGDQVRVKLKDLNNASLNKMRQAFKMLDIPEEKVEILMKTGTVLGIDDDIDVIVSFGDGKNYGLKPEQLQKI